MSGTNGNPADGSKELKHEDIQQHLNLFSSEFNESALHDRVLVFQVIKDENEELPNESSSITRSQDHATADQSHGDVEEDMMEAADVDRAEMKYDNTAETSHGSGSHAGLLHQTNPVEEHRVLVHSCWLAVQSPYFKSLFYSGMKESHLREVVMEVTEGELQGYLTLIEAMYKLDILNEKNYKLVTQVLLLADKHDVNLVFKKCKYVLLGTPHTLESCQYVWQHAQHLPHCEDLRDHLQKFLLNHFTPFKEKWTSNEFVQLSEVLVELLLSSDSLVVESENTVFAALMKWIEYNQKSPCSCSLLSVVRFEFLTSDFLCDVVDGHPIASQMFGYEQHLHEGLLYRCYSQERIDLMEDKPVQRKKSDVPKNLPTRTIKETLSIDKNARDQLLDPNKSHKVSWVSFWLHGYELFLELVYTGTGNTNPLDDNFDLYLKTKNIIHNNAYLKVSWEFISTLPETKGRRFSRNTTVFGRDGFSSKLSFYSNVFASVVPDNVFHKIGVVIAIHNI